MKKLLLFCAFIAVSVFGFSQTETKPKKPFKSHEVHFNLGDPTYAFMRIYDYYYDYNLGNSWLRTDAYEKWSVYTPAITAGYLYRPLKWFWVGGDISYMTRVDLYHDIITDDRLGKSETHLFSISPYVRFSYLNREKVNLYSGVGLGILHYFETYYNSNGFGYQSELGFQVTFIGVSFGKALFGSAELGVGYKGIFNMGIGYRF